MLFQQPFQPILREPRPAQLVLFRVDTVIVAGGEVGFYGYRIVEKALVEVAVVKHHLGEISIHEIYRHHAAVGEQGALYLEGVEFRIIKPAVLEFNRKKQLVAHGEVHARKTAVVEERPAQRHIVDFSFAEVAPDEVAVDERRTCKVALRKVAAGKGALLKILVHYLVSAKYLVGYLFPDDIVFGHSFFLRKIANNHQLSSVP
jgi:hypothetical protein